MAALKLTAKAPPIFLSKNYFNRHADLNSDLIVSSGASLDHRLYDMDPAAQWTSAGSDDTVLESIVAGLWLPGAQTARDIALIAILNHNLADFDLYLSGDNGASWPDHTALTANILTDRIFDFSASPIEADKLKITALKTMTANAEKLVGSIVAASVLLQPSIGMSMFQRLPYRQQCKEATMADGSKRRARIGRSDASAYFTDFSIGISGLDEDEADTLEGILLGDDPFIFYPEPYRKPGKMWLGQAAKDTVTRNDVTLSQSGGEAITFDFEEVGGA